MTDPVDMRSADERPGGATLEAVPATPPPETVEAERARHFRRAEDALRSVLEMCAKPDELPHSFDPFALAADALAAARPKIAHRPPRTFAAAYTAEDLDRDRNRSLVEFARLPAWPGDERKGDHDATAGHGWGAHLDRMLGGGVSTSGELVGVGAASAGAGKTSFVMQLANGLALQSAAVVRGDARWSGRPITPVLVVSEMDAQTLTWRGLGRWLGVPGSWFRAGRSGVEGYRGDGGERRAMAWKDASAALEAGAYAEARGFLAMAPREILGAMREGVAPFVDAIGATLGAWRTALEKAHPGAEVCPVLVVDPVQRCTPPGATEIEALAELARALREFAMADGAIVLATSDTNKASAKGENRGGGDVEEAVAAFRSTYQLIHEATAAVYLRKPPKAPPHEPGTPIATEAVVFKSRWGGAWPPWPRFDRWGAEGRWVALSEDGVRRREDTERAAADDASPSTGSKRRKATEGAAAARSPGEGTYGGST